MRLPLPTHGRRLPQRHPLPPHTPPPPPTATTTTIHPNTLQPPPARLLWAPYFALKCVYFIALDAVDRGAFNRVFYRHYAGRDAGGAGEQAQYVYREYLQPK